MATVYDAADFPSFIKIVNRYVHNIRLCPRLLFSPYFSPLVSFIAGRAADPGIATSSPSSLGPWCYNFDGGIVKVPKIIVQVHGLERPRRYLEPPIEQHVYRTEGEVLHHIVLHWQSWLCVIVQKSKYPQVMFY